MQNSRTGRVSQRGAARVGIQPPAGQTAAGSGTQPQRLEQSASEGAAQEEVDERIQERVQGREEQRALLQLKEEELEFAVEEQPPGLAHGVGHAGEVERDEADEEHGQHQEDVGAHFLFGLLRPPSRHRTGACASARVGLVQLPGDESVAHDHGHQVPPEDDLADVVDHLVPPEPVDRLQVAALEVVPLGLLPRQDHVRQAEEQEEGPDGPRQEFATGQPSRVGPAEGPQRLPAAVDADEAEEEDADVHGEVEEHGGNSTHEYAQLCGGHV